MNVLALMTFGILSANGIATEVATNVADFPAPLLTINLDLPPKQRWASIGKHYAAQTNITLAYLRKMAGKGTVLHPVVEALKNAVLEGHGWSEDQLAELQGLADAAGFALDDVMMANLFYEFGTFCTSIVAEDENGHILHARNQDYSIPGLVDITVQIAFVKNNVTIYRGNTFVGYIGLPTIQRLSAPASAHGAGSDGADAANVGGWGVSADSRFNGGGVDILEGITTAKQGGKTIGIFLRDMAEKHATYKEALEGLNTTLLIAPAYFIISGTKTGEGAVVTRGRTGPDNSHGEGIWPIDLKSDAWWRLETNFDHWGPIQDGRRGAANTMMKLIGREHVTLDKMFDLLSVPPVLASDTIYTTVMRHDTNEYHSTIRTHNSSSPAASARKEGPAVGNPFQYFEAMRAAMDEAGML